ncbi:MAG: aminoacyl-tRNA hydrolase [Bacilli bacterium]|jgi:PTH1 family peptidyl-tRNA hydrolase|nr:aminoacyl-tRNA hydrolase [Bacilli bacterium]
MKLIVGLGNPGKEYENTRHNMGFMALDLLLAQYHIELNKRKFNGLYYQGEINNEKIIILKPQTYMNLSGECVSQFSNFFKIPIENIIIIYDDMDTLIGKIRIRSQGSSGGQKGIQNIINHLHTTNINRIRVGIGTNTMNNIRDYVLSKISISESNLINEALELAKDASIDFITNDIDKVMNKFNKK